MTHVDGSGHRIASVVLSIIGWLVACSPKADGEARTADAGAASDGDGGGAGDAGPPCALPPGQDEQCPPDRPTEIRGGAIDATRHCRLTSGEFLGCAGTVGGAHTCHVEKATGTIYDVSVFTCMPDGWRECTDAEEQILADSQTTPCP